VRGVVGGVLLQFHPEQTRLTRQRTRAAETGLRERHAFDRTAQISPELLERKSLGGGPGDEVPVIARNHYAAVTLNIHPLIAVGIRENADLTVGLVPAVQIRLFVNLG